MLSFVVGSDQSRSWNTLEVKMLLWKGLHKLKWALPREAGDGRGCLPLSASWRCHSTATLRISGVLQNCVKCGSMCLMVWPIKTLFVLYVSGAFLYMGIFFSGSVYWVCILLEVSIPVLMLIGCCYIARFPYTLIPEMIDGLDGEVVVSYTVK